MPEVEKGCSVLNFSRTNEKRFPILALLAKNIIRTPISTA